ncbi:unnamed protein product, partial [marine sediment metagenome]
MFFIEAERLILHKRELIKDSYCAALVSVFVAGITVARQSIKAANIQ